MQHVKRTPNAARTMHPPEPAYVFTIPSLHDSTPLDCRIYHPVDFLSTKKLSGSPAHVNGFGIRGAIIAHPYAPLGGCYDDPVVMTVLEQMLECGFVVGTFNFR